MEDMEDLLNIIKVCWPKFTISKQDLLYPTQELVVRFYNNFIEDYNEKVTYLTGVPVITDFNVIDCEPEQQLFIQLSRLLGEIDGLKFTLADIYRPLPVRTKNFFKICIHLVVFTENLQNETDELSRNVFQMKQDVTNLSAEQQTLLSEINDNAENKAELEENINLLKLHYVTTKDSFKEIKVLKAVRQKAFLEKKNLLENCKCELQNGEHELHYLENKEKDLLEQKITENEHQNILHTLNAMKNEFDTLNVDDDDIGSGLIYENQVLQHTKDLIRLLDNCDFTVLTQIKKLIQKEDEFKILLNTVDKLTSTRLNPNKLERIKTEEKLVVVKQQLADLQNEFKNIKDSYEISLNTFLQDYQKFKDYIEDESNTNCNAILCYKKNIEELKERCNELKKAFATQYIRVSSVEKKVLDEFQETLLRFKQMEE
ncbi:hypothetical protein NQ315_004627 [Exocentrus adspersus]|uniref:Kinetochore protein Nuf2 N-terminal domain-containing protein n=1 Tax=Exocentrus adspersus TaxID=1586481 RepID=A0AAV8VPR9_9CUCU|nr:hypothetical protein NQ315_004627 [Exocentrus adspersus]